MSDERIIHQLLIERKQTLALAESCTGGHLAARFTSLPDASRYFLGALISYSNPIKQKMLGVQKLTLLEHGAVSRETVHEMWVGLLKEFDADYGIAVTGIAGPSGGTKEKPVGSVYIALGEKGKKPRIIGTLFKGDRLSIIQQAVDQALFEFKELLYPFT